MNQKKAVLILLLLCGFSALHAQSQRSKVVVAPYTVNIYTITGTGGKGTLITSSSSIQENTVYYVEVITSTDPDDTAGLLCRLFNGFEAGFWSGGQFVPYTDSSVAQGDGETLAFRIRTFSGWDFVTPLSMRVYECLWQLGSCSNPGGSGWQNQRLISFP